MTTTDAPLRLLLVEDQRQDAELICEALSGAGYAFTFTRVETEADYSAALDGQPDVVLCDHVLPEFSSLRALIAERNGGVSVAADANRAPALEARNS